MLLRINEQIVTEVEQNLLNTEEFVGIKTGFINWTSLQTALQTDS